MAALLAEFPSEVGAALGHKKPEPSKVTEKPEEETEEVEETPEEEVPEEEEVEEEHQVPANIQKRIDKLTRKRNEAREEARAARAEIETLKGELEGRSAITLSPTPENPLADVENLSDLDTRIGNARRIRSWALANPDGGTIRNADGTDRYVDQSEVRQWIASTDALLTDHAPSRREYLQQRSQMLPAAREAYPDLFKSESPAHKILVDTLKAVPALKRLPGYEMVIGDAMVGIQLRLQKNAKPEGGTGKKPAEAAKPVLPAKPKIAPAIPRSSGAGKPPSTTGKAKGAALQRVLASGDVDSLADYFNS